MVFGIFGSGIKVRIKIRVLFDGFFRVFRFLFLVCRIGYYFFLYLKNWKFIF